MEKRVSIEQADNGFIVRTHQWDDEESTSKVYIFLSWQDMIVGLITFFEISFPPTHLYFDSGSSSWVTETEQ